MKYTLDGVQYTRKELEKYAEDNGLSIYWDSIADANKLEEAEIINPENHQRTIMAIIPQEDAPYEEARKDLSVTSQYYDWSDTAADRVTDILEHLIAEEEEDEEEMAEFEKTELKEAIKEYNEQVDAYNNYGDAKKLTYREAIKNPEEMQNTIANNL
jgi:acyl-CoA reductase-like NAD-dependent aldehyde dehydrogenase|tara:strand:+ start:10277 stop:10747 length:471 start_codon:yes stop_codon:yes gene_type:complete